MRFGVLGPLEVWTSDGRPVRVRETRVRTLLTALLVHRGRAVAVDRLVDALWGDAPPANDVRTLRSKVSLLRRTLEDAEPGGRDLIESRPAGYLLRVADDAVDAGRFEALLRRVRTVGGDPRAKARLLGEAAALWRGTKAFADHADEEFVRAEARRFEEQRLAALEELAEARLALGEHALLAGELGELVAANPLRERLRSAHVRALYLAGRQDEALASLGELRDRLRDDLGLDPGHELAALHEAILRQDAALAPAAAPEARPRHTLPVPLTDLIGRIEEVRRIDALLSAERLVTLTGPGGVGKTRLALAVAARRAGELPDGVLLVELATARTAAEAHEAVAAVLGLRDDLRAPVRHLSDQLADALAGRATLLVLDNCEHVVEPVAELTARLLSAAPALRVLATSREPLAVVGELRWPVEPLGLPEPSGPSGTAGTGGTDLDRLERSDAVRLFVARATAAAPDFRVEPGSAAAVATICRRLDGIPLALEMAAARLRVMSVADLAARLDDRFRLLTATLRAVPTRQRTLRATIDWSWDLLGEPERIALRRLAACADGCGLAAAEAVLADGPVRREDVLDLLGRLVDRSLVVQRDGRYRLLESVAAYGAERLAEADGEDERRTRDRHVAYYVDFAEHADARLRGREQRHWLARFKAEAANVRAALAHAVRHGLAEEALRLVNALAWSWFLRGRFAEARRSFDLALTGGGTPERKAVARAWRAGMSQLLLDARDSDGQAAVKLCDAIEDPAGRARARWFTALGRAGFGDPAVTLDLADRAHAGFVELGDEWGEAAALSVRAEALLYRAKHDQARADALRARARFRELGDGWGRLQTTYVLGDLAETTGDYRAAERLREEGHRLADDLELWHDASKMLSRLGRTAVLTGDLDRARELHERARRLAVAHGYQRGEEFAEVGLGLVARRQGRPDDAEAHLRAWLDWCHRWEGDHGVAFILAELGFIAEQRGDADTARKLHREGLDHAGRTGDPRAVALACEGLAGAEALAGEHVRAARLLGVAAAARDAVGAPLPEAERGDVDRITEVVRAGLAPQAYDDAFGQGAAIITPADHQGADEPWPALIAHVSSL
ncbi:BTAD domain-containing putative transcriptional regulator [Saccharothrix australiensis]|uniref:Putative ATPase n=1 Tax=Saccharothrix australiensis TaxID=2072 RepID=A0A495VZP3_9PSEU|nr:BTAD domain-containing putative transcriptional regulator [Saccharothrix australiensis]RKT54679.1 putative ATPase [Saccharothrix australiensis]